jgi:tetratricopeptide (TPR) repeat protein
MKLIRQILFPTLILCLLLPTAALAQSAVRQAGKVLDPDDKPIAGAKVVATDTRTHKSQDTKTDKDGRFTFKRLFEGSYTFTITKEGFIGQQVAKELMGQETTLLIIHLQPDPAANKPTNEDFTKGVQLLQSQQYAQAKEIFKRFVDAYPDLTAAWVDLGICCFGMQDFAGAAEAFDTVLKLEPENANVMLLDAQAQTQLRDIPKAIELYEKYLAAKPEDFEYWHILGQLYNYEKNREKALECFDKALAIKPDYADSHLMKGFTLIDLNRNDEAIPHLVRYIELQPNASDAKKASDALATIYLENGKKLMEELKYQEAIENLSKYLELKPDAEDAEEVKAMIEAAKAEIQ